MYASSTAASKTAPGASVATKLTSIETSGAVGTDVPDVPVEAGGGEAAGGGGGLGTSDGHLSSDTMKPPTPSLIDEPISMPTSPPHGALASKAEPAGVQM